MADVFIGCKLPNGLLMEIIDPVGHEAGKPAGNYMMPGPVPMKRVMLKGANSMRATVKENPLIGKYAITAVDESFWQVWLARHKDFLFIKNGSVFMEKTLAAAQGKAKHDREALTGLEPLNPEKDSRTPKATGDKDRLKALLAGSEAP